MIAVKYSSILAGVKDLAGIPAADTLVQRALLRGLISRRIHNIWQQTFWPMISKWEERTVTADAVNGDHILLTEAGLDTIDAIEAVRDGNPFLGSTTANIAWRKMHLGYTVTAGYATVWAFYRKLKPRLEGDSYSVTTTYAIGDQVYSPTEGDFFDCIAVTTGDAVTDAAYWTRIEIPLEFEPYLVNGAYADYLRNDGQEEKSVAIAEIPAKQALKHALFVLKAAQGHQTKPRIRTY